MTLFKKKPNQPVLYAMLNARLEENGDNVFYFALREDEVETAREWATTKHLQMEISHKTGKCLIYKFNRF